METNEPVNFARRGASLKSLSHSRELALDVPQEIRRAVSLDRVLAGFGRVMGSLSLSSRETPDDLWKMSKEVDTIDDFISHSWASRRSVKVMTLLFVHNSTAAMVLSILAMLICAGLEWAGQLGESLRVLWHLGTVDVWISVWGMIIPLGVFMVVLCFWQRLKQVLFLRRSVVFFDKICVHQSDEEKKKRAVLSLAGFLQVSRRLVILWSPTYFSRLWCVYEVACWVHFGRDLSHSVLLAPVNTCSALLLLLALLYSAFFVLVLLNSVLTWLMLLMVIVVTTACAGMILRWILSDFKELKRTLKGFKAEESKCFCCSNNHIGSEGQTIPCDRKLVYGVLESWFQSLEGEPENLSALDTFNNFIQTEVYQFIANQTFSPWALYRFGLLLSLGGLWYSIALAAGSVPVFLSLGATDVAARQCIWRVLAGFVYHPSLFLFSLRPLSAFDRCVGDCCAGSRLSILVHFLSFFIVPVAASLAALIPLLGNLWTVGRDSPVPFIIFHTVRTLVCICNFLLPWRP